MSLFFAQRVSVPDNVMFPELEREALNDAANVRDIYEPFDLHGATAKPESP
jgi:hypothetical protein